MLTRLGVIGDVHAQETLLRIAIEHLSARGVTQLVATGDIVDGRGSVDACCELLQAHCVTAVRGNHERWLLAEEMRDLIDATKTSEISPRTRQYLAGLPPTTELPTNRGLALLCHGLGANDMAAVRPDDFGYALETNDDLQQLLRKGRYRWIINGHSHRRMVRAFPGLTVINAGTLKPEHQPGFLEIDFERGLVFLFEFDETGNIRTTETPLVEQ